MNPDNVLMGDSNMGIDLPQVVPNNKELLPEKQMANYAKTEGFKTVQDWCRLKIAYHQSFLPGNMPVTAVPEEERGKYWAVADLVIADLYELMNMYENAVEVVENASISA